MDASTIGRQLAEATKDAMPRVHAASIHLGWVHKVNGDGTIDINRGTLEKPELLLGVRCTSACYGAMAGDRVVYEDMNHRCYATGVLAKSSGPAVYKVVDGVTAIKSGGVVTVSLVYAEVKLTDYWSTYNIGTLPVGWRPPCEVSAPIAMSEMPTTARLAVRNSGMVSVVNMSGTAIPKTRRVYGCLTYAVGG